MRIPCVFTTAGRIALSISLAAVAACTGGNRVEYTEPPAGSYRQGTHQLQIDAVTASVSGATLAPEFFRIAGIQPLLGRLFVEGEYQSASDVIVLSHQLWTERFEASPSVIGREVTIDERPRRVVGIMPSGFSFPDSTQVWMPGLPDGAS